MRFPLLLVVVAAAFSSPAVLRADLPAPDPDDGGLSLPNGFRALVFADNLVVDRRVEGRPNNLRFLAVAPNGDVYAKTKRGPLLALRDSDGDGRADIVKEFGGGGGTGLQLRDGWLYHSTDAAVFRYRLTPGELVPTGEPEPIVIDLPNQRTHESKSFFFDDQGRLVVEVGVPSNAYGGENDRRLGAKGSDATEFLKTYGGFWRFAPDRLNQRQSDGEHISTGHRHVVGVAWNRVSRSAFFVMHGRDNLSAVAPQFYSDDDNAELPAEEFHELREGLNAGWPYTYYDAYRRRRMVGPEFGGDGRTAAEPNSYANPLLAFPAHWAPLQMAFYHGEQFPDYYRGGAFVAFHGSWNRAPRPQRGYNVTFIPFTNDGRPRGGYQVFASGFPGRTEFTSPSEAMYRPGSVAVGPDGSLYIGDTQKGRIWRVIYTGDRGAPVLRSFTDAARASASTAPAGASSPVLNAQGRELYLQLCASCHMGDGTGVSNLQPNLVESTVVKGDPDRLLRVILHGPAAALPSDRPTYSNVMPPFSGMLSNRQAADLANYVRAAFGQASADVAPAQVGRARSAR